MTKKIIRQALQKEFREIEISNARFLNHSITAYINEKERDNIFAFSVDLHYSEVAKTVHMPILNVKNPKGSSVYLIMKNMHRQLV